MPNVNKVILIGNLTRDPELRYTPKGTALVELGMAINRRYTADNGEVRDETTFVDITLWGKTAEIAGQYLKKGRPVYIEGRLQLDTWDDKKTGEKRSKMRVIGEQMQLLGDRDGRAGGASRGGEEEMPEYRPSAGNSHSGSSGGGGGGRPAPSSRPVSAPKPPSDPDLDVEGDEIPF